MRKEIKMTAREEQKKQRRAVILKAALDLFIRKGYGNTKIADIANAADMSMGLLFHYYESKEKLYEELIRIGSEKLKMEVAFSSESPLSVFQTAAEDVLGMLRTNPFSAKMFVLMENAQYMDALPPDVKELLLESDRLVKKSIPVIEKGQELGEIRAGDAKALAIAFWCSLQGIAQYIAVCPDAPCPDAAWVISLLTS